MSAHLWRKSGTNVDESRIVRAWACKRCAASKVETKDKRAPAPRRALTRVVSAEKCKAAS